MTKRAVVSRLARGGRAGWCDGVPPAAGGTEPRGDMERDLILTCDQSPGDVVMMTAAVRDLHLAHPGRFRTDVRTTASALWENNPHLTPLSEDEPGVEVILMRYDLINQSNQGPYHFIHGYRKHL